MINLIMLFIIYGCLGWIVEVAYVRILTGNFYNRGFLHMPFLPIYATGAVIVTVTLQSIDNPVLLFFFTVILTSILEYGTSAIMERLFHTRWWDYSKVRFNINGRICARNSLLFGVLGLFVIKISNPFFFNLIDKVSFYTKTTIVDLFIALFIIDLAYTLRNVSNLPIRDIRIISGKVKAYRDGKLKSLEELLEELEEFKLRDELKKYTNRFADKFEIHRLLISAFTIIIIFGLILNNIIVLELLLIIIVLAIFGIFYNIKHKNTKSKH